MVSAASHMSPAADPEKDSLTRQAPRLLSAGVSAFRTYRLSGIAQRAAYEIRLRSRLFGFQERRLLSMTRASSALELEPSDLSDLREWFQRPENLGAADRVIAATRSLQSGRYALYGGDAFEIGWPPRWHRDPSTGHLYSADAHWSSTVAEHPDIDIKDVWEVSRLSFLELLSRAFVASGDDQWAEMIWQAIESWHSENPPFIGSAWVSGQEVAIRGITIMHVTAGLTNHPSSTAERTRARDELLDYSAARICPTIGYANSQRNNHIVAEASFLWALGTLRTGRWGSKLRSLGSQTLAEAVCDQFRPDGTYAQHSFNYQRLAMHLLCWVDWIARRTGHAPPIETASILRTAAEPMAALCDDNSGYLPNWGGNDGALLFRLSDCDHQDMRPLLAHVNALTDTPNALGTGPWEEELLWFGLKPKRSLNRGQIKTQARWGPLHVFEGPASKAMLRAGPLQHRLAHADQLHVDVWMGGRNVALDAGSYRYTAPAPWRNVLAFEEAHNLPVVPGRPQARRVGRFFWLDWPEPKELAAVETRVGRAVVANLVLPGRPWVSLRRLVANVEDHYVVADRADPIGAQVRWHLAPEATLRAEGELPRAVGDGFQVGFWGSGTKQIEHATDAPLEGWASRIYGQRERTTTIVVTVSPGEIAFAEFCPAGEQLVVGMTLQTWSTALEYATTERIEGALNAMREALAD